MKDKFHCCHFMGYSFQLAASNLLLAYSTDSICFTSHGALAVFRNSSVDLPWGIDPMTHHITSGHFTPELYISSTARGCQTCDHGFVSQETGYLFPVSPNILQISFRLILFSLWTHWAISRIQQVVQDWCNKGCAMYYPICGMVHIKYILLLIENSSLCSCGSRFLFLAVWMVLYHLSDAI